MECQIVDCRLQIVSLQNLKSPISSAVSAVEYSRLQKGKAEQATVC
jgi:hypothetical protein